VSEAAARIIGWIPNGLSLVRLACAPVLLGVAGAQMRGAFWITLGIMFGSDVVDGILARRLGAESELGRRLDSAGDYAAAIAIPVSLTILWPGTMRAQAPWIMLAVAAFFAPMTWFYARYHTLPSYHTWAAKAGGAMLSAAIVALFGFGVAWPMRVAALFQVVAAAEEFAIGRLLPGWSGSVASLWHARRMRVALNLRQEV
jgi:phosphatidylglycerophosphate synthase